MVAPAIAGALISGGASLLGGLFGRSQRKKDSYMNSPQGIRANAEAAGFNPLVFAGPGTGTGASYAPRFGNAIAEAGAALASGIVDDEALKIQKAELELENRRLTEQIKNSQLKANVPGVYGRINKSGLRDTSSLNDDTGADAGVRDVELSFRGVKPKDIVHGTVPYVSAGGTVVPGPNPETQMGIDEVAGWLLMEGYGAFHGLGQKFWKAGERSRLAADKNRPTGKRSSRREMHKYRNKQPQPGWMTDKFGSFHTN